MLSLKDHVYIIFHSVIHFFRENISQLVNYICSAIFTFVNSTKSKLGYNYNADVFVCDLASVEIYMYIYNHIEVVLLHSTNV